MILEGIVDVPVQMICSVKVVLEARDRVVAQNNPAILVSHLKIFSDLYEFTQKPSVITAVVVAADQKLLAVQRFQNPDRVLHPAPEHIAEHVDDVAWSDGGIPSLDQHLIHLQKGLERTVVERDNIGVAVMPIGNVEFFITRL